VEIKASTIWANGLEFGLLEAGGGPLALCLHGFADTARTWRYLLPELAAAGFRAVAPFLRGYAPTAAPDDGRYGIGALAGDAGALHEVLGGDGHAVLIGHDWGAEAAYAAAALAPDRWRLVTLAVPPAALDPLLFSDYEQLKRFFYIFLFRETSGMAEEIVAADGMAFIKRLWQDWSPGFDAADCVEQVRQSLADPGQPVGGDRLLPRRKGHGLPWRGRTIRGGDAGGCTARSAADALPAWQRRWQRRWLHRRGSRP
jgi:pimeloyl-ACP methyl ester carboxylesterase